ncbi:MAG: hypothetical protein KAJ97_10490 [Acidobacteria bacterium]|nr:hypothetical protein [Acidobacteriota bacterium]
MVAVPFLALPQIVVYRASHPAVAGCLLAVFGVTLAGLFEYSWGDAEVWILTLMCIASPFALIPAEQSIHE